MTSKVFADTVYWVAVMNPRDQWHQTSIEMRQMLGDIRIVTTETVMIEFLNHFSKAGPESRLSAVQAVRTIIESDEVDYLPHNPLSFSMALDMYEARPDKGYSLTDCISMIVMKSLDLREVLSHDDHFRQEGFTVLL